MKRTLCSVAGFAAAFAALLSTFPGPASADLDKWILSIRATDLNGYNSSGTVRIGWKEGYTNGTDFGIAPGFGEDTPPGQTWPTGPPLATVVALHDATTMGLYDYRFPLSIDWRSVTVYKLGVYWQIYGERNVTDLIKVKLYADERYSFPYGTNGSITVFSPQAIGGVATWRFTGSNPLPEAGFTFVLPGKMTYDYYNPDIFVIATVPEAGSGFALLFGLISAGGLLMRRRRVQ